jgi:hypothetical protein
MAAVAAAPARGMRRLARLERHIDAGCSGGDRGSSSNGQPVRRRGRGAAALGAGCAPQRALCSAPGEPTSLLDEDGILVGAVPHSVPILDMQCESIRGFDLDTFLVEGRWYWKGVMLPWVRRSWTAALKRVQQYQDEMVLSDWSVHGWEQPSPEDKQLMLCGSGSTGRPSFDAFRPSPDTELGMEREQRLREIRSLQQQNLRDGVGDERGTDARVRQLFQGIRKPRLPLNPGSWPEHFCVGSDAFLMSVFTHPDLLALHRMMLGEEIRFDHTTLLNRTPGFMGQRYHSHGYVEDNAGVTTHPGGAALRMVRTLCYPEVRALARTHTHTHTHTQACFRKRRPRRDEENIVWTYHLPQAYVTKRQQLIGWLVEHRVSNHTTTQG